MEQRSSFRSKFKQQPIVVVPYRLIVAARRWVGINLCIIEWFRAVGGFLTEYVSYRRGNANPHFSMRSADITPCLLDRTTATPLEPTYFYQDSWAAGKIFTARPEHHYDVGSSAMTVGIISQFVPTTMIDIRPIELKLDGLMFREGSITALPFPDNSLESLSSLCVVEHIGLGRYGDPVDCWGSEKASHELQRVLSVGGSLYLSVPVDAENCIYFNAHRAFTREYIVSLFEGMDLVSEKYIYGKTMLDSYDKTRGFGTGLFHFVKRSLALTTGE